jgi:hypothetical protein
MARMGRNAGAASVRVAKAAVQRQKILASKEEIDRRLAICVGCEFFQSRGDGRMQCLKCGCFLAPKTRLETEHCPINKW